jgi:tyrosine-protein kinase Etk/Wzc
MSDHIQENTEPDINLLDLLIALGQEKWTLIVVTFLAAITGVAVSLMTPATYVSRTSIMPSQQSGGGVGSLGSLGSLAGLAGLGALTNMSSSIKSSEEMYIALMRSQSVQSALIEQFKLKERYGVKNTEEARQALTQNVVIVVEKKSGLLFIDAQDKEPEFAAKLANAQANELNVILSRLAVTDAQNRRAFYEQQIVKTQSKILQLDLEFKGAQKSSGLELASLLSEAGTLPGQIAAKELQLQVLSRFATTQNPEIKRLAGEIAALRSQMARYELNKTEVQKPGAPLGYAQKGDMVTSPLTPNNPKTSFVQKATLAYNTLKIQEALLDGYVKQLELAKVDEAKEGPAVQVVDEAKVPEVRAKPERKKLVIAYTITGFIVAFVLAILRAFMRHIKSSPDGQQRWSQLKRAWGFA